MSEQLFSDDEVFGTGAADTGLLSDEDVFGAPKSSPARRAADYGITALKGAIGVPEAAVGLADMASGGLAGKWLEDNAGFRPKEAKHFLDDYYSPEQKAANRAVQGADGFVDTASAALQNPSTIAHAAVESLPMMGAGGVIGRSVLAATPKIVQPWAAGAVGEGVMGAGSAAENIRQETADGLMTGKQTGAALASGLGTAAFGALGGKISQKLGISDVDTMLAGGAAQASNKGLARRMLEGGISEGVFEELPQSMQEQVWQNYALDKPLDQGVGHAAAMGLLTGAAMGAAGGNFHGKAASNPAEPPPASETPDDGIAGLLPAPPAIIPPTNSGGVDTAAVAAAQNASDALWEERASEETRRESAMQEYLARGNVDYSPVSPADYLPGEAQAKPAPAADMESVDYQAPDMNAFAGAPRPATASLDMPAVDSPVIDPNAGPLSRAAHKGIASGIAGAFAAMPSQTAAPPLQKPVETLARSTPPTPANAGVVASGVDPSALPEAQAANPAPTAQAAQWAPTEPYSATPTAAQPESGNGTNPASEIHAAMASSGAETGRVELPGSGSLLASSPAGDAGNASPRPEMAESGLRPAMAFGISRAEGVAQNPESNAQQATPEVSLTIGSRPASEVPIESLHRLAGSKLPTAGAARSELDRRQGIADRANAALMQLQKSAGHLGFVPATLESPVVQEIVARQDGRIGVAEVGKAIDGETGNRFTRATLMDTPANREKILKRMGAQIAPQPAAPVGTNVPEAPGGAPGSSAIRARQSPIMRRDDLAGAVMRVTGGRGIAAHMAETIIGEKANRAGGLRGVFSSQGVMDLDDTATHLRESEGYDVRDGNHLAELLREQSNGLPVHSLARQEQDASANAEKQYRSGMREKAGQLGIKTVGRKFSELEAEVLAEEARQHEAEVMALDAQALTAYHALVEEVGSLGVDASAVLADLPDGLSPAESYRIASSRLVPIIKAKLAEINARAQSAAYDDQLNHEESRHVESYGITGRTDPGNAGEGDATGRAETGAGRDARTRGEAAVQPAAGDVGEFSLEKQSPADLKRQEADRLDAEKSTQEKNRTADDAQRKTQEQAEVRRRADFAASTFTLGGDAMDNLTGQGGLFDAPANKSGAKKADSGAGTDLDTLFDELLDEELSAQPQSIDGRQKSKPPAGQRTARQALGSAARNTVSGLGSAIDGLGKLFGGAGRLNSGLSFDEETYAKAKPLFQQTIAHLSAAGSDIREAMRTVVRMVLDKFGAQTAQNMKPYVVRFIADTRDGFEKNGTTHQNEDSQERGNGIDERSSTDLERNRQDADTADGMGTQGIRHERHGTGGTGGSGIQADPGEIQLRSGGELRGDDAASPGERGDLEIYTGAPRVSRGSAGSSVDQRGGDAGIAGAPVEPDAAKATRELATGASELAQKREAQASADRLPYRQGLSAIRAELPFLLEGQQEDVHKAETRFAQDDGYGILFTNGTGTGKTFTGLGIVKRFAKQGRKNILVAAPNDKIIEDWQKSGKMLGLDISVLASTRDAGSGIVITTYANAGQNDALASRDWDLIVKDESHYLAMDKEGSNTLALKTLRAISLHPDGVGVRAEMQNRDLVDRMAALSTSISAANKSMDSIDQKERIPDSLQTEIARDEKELAGLRKIWDARREAVKKDVFSRQGAQRTRVTFLSATPFAYEKTVDWANGYLFDYNEGRPGDEGASRGYNVGANREQFFMQHFGYRMRYGKLTQPDARVDSGLMQRQFNAWLKKRGVLSGRVLDVAADYDRRFVLVDSAIGQRIDEALQWFEHQKKLTVETTEKHPRKDALAAVGRTIAEKFDYLSRRYLLEAIKAQEVVPHIREHLALGRKVVVFHDYKKGGGFNPFNLNTV